MPNASCVAWLIMLHLCCWSFLCSTILRFQADSLSSCHTCFYMNDFYMNDSVAFYSAFWISTEVVYLQCCLDVTVLFGCYMAGAMWNHCHLSAFHVHHSTIRIHRVHVSFVVTCLQPFWQNDRDLLRATAVTQGWNRHQNKRLHRKLAQEKNSPATATGTQTQNLLIMSLAL